MAILIWGCVNLSMMFGSFALRLRQAAMMKRAPVLRVFFSVIICGKKSLNVHTVRARLGYRIRIHSGQASTSLGQALRLKTNWPICRNCDELVEPGKTASRALDKA